MNDQAANGNNTPMLERQTSVLSNISASNPPPPRPPPVLSTRLVLQLSKTSAPLKNIVRDQELPRVVQCDGATAPLVELPFNVYEPLMIYKKRTIRKVAAQSVVFNKEIRELVETGGDILIPEDYPGWFVVLGPPSEIKSESHIPHFRVVCRLATSSCRKFLVGGSTLINGFTRIPGGHGWETCKIFPGDVLRKGAIYQERRELTKKEKKKQKKNTVKKKHIGTLEKSGNVLVATDMYLSCYDSREREIFLPGWQEGVFFILAQDGAPVKSPVLQMNELLQRFKFPLVVKLLYGPVPRAPCSFNDTLLLTESGMNHTVIASTLENIRNINLEIPLDNDMLFYLAEQNSGLTMSRQYRRVLAECYAKVPSYEKNMKVLLGAVVDEKLSDTDSDSKDSKFPSLVSEDVPIENTTRPDDSTPPMRLRRSSDRHSRRSSRLSIISRLITVNPDDQNIFAPTVPSSPFSPPTPQSSKSKQPSFKSKSLSENKNIVPENLDLVQEFVPPEVPEMIPSTPPVRGISRDGESKLKAFQKTFHHRHEYETPNSLLQSAEESTDSDVYGSIWQSSTDSHRQSAAGIKINCKIGQPTNLSINVVPEHSVFETNDLDTEMCSQSSSVSSNSFLTDLNSPTSDDVHNSPLSPRDVSDVLYCGGDSQEDNGYQRPHENPHPTDVTPTPSLPNPFQDPYHSTISGTDSMPHIYNAVMVGPQYQNQRLQTVSLENASTENHVVNDTSINGVYLTPTETDQFAINENQMQPVSNPYEQPGDIWRVSSTTEEGCVVYELNDAGDDLPVPAIRNADSGIYEGEEPPGSLPLEDHYDRPIASAQASFEVNSDTNSIYDVPIQTHSPNFTKGKLQHSFSEENDKVPSRSSPRVQPSHINGAVRLPFMLPTQVDAQPPPLPENHPVRPTIDLLKRIPGAITSASPAKSNRDALIEELKNEGLKPSSELAIRALQIADISMLAQRKDDLDETLVALLPKVGQVDLRKIALCIQKMGIRLIND